MKKGFFLSSCSTCNRIIQEVTFPLDLEWIDIKGHPIGSEDLEEICKKAGSYEAIFSKKAMKYASIKTSLVNEKSYRDWLLKEYTFLKRPVIIYDDFISVGNGKKEIIRLKATFGSV
ncbi:MAG: arsenate reductase [Bacteroidetes bacterium]|nr:arsenate reductase [Bacteroidota bacterium]